MKYREKPVVVDAVKWTGENTSEVFNLTNGSALKEDDCIIISDIRGARKAFINDWVVKYGNFGFNTMSDYTFKKAYELAE